MLRNRRCGIAIQSELETAGQREVEMNALAGLGATLTIGLGIFGLVAPLHAAKWVGLSPMGTRGIAEIRATYGGLFVAIGLVCLVLRQPPAFAVASAAWLGAALARAISMVLTRDFSRANAGGVVLEAGIGGLLAFGAEHTTVNG